MAEAERALAALRGSEGLERERQGELKRAAEELRERAAVLAVDLSAAQDELAVRAQRLTPCLLYTS